MYAAKQYAYSFIDFFSPCSFHVPLAAFAAHSDILRRTPIYTA